jgi:hypothetical protein
MLEEFLKSSPVAESVHVQGNVILHRMKLSTDDLAEILKNGEFITERDKSKRYELEINGLTVAAGRIVKKRGEYVFKVTDITREERR